MGDLRFAMVRSARALLCAMLAMIVLAHGEPTQGAYEEESSVPPAPLLEAIEDEAVSEALSSGEAGQSFKAEALLQESQKATASRSFAGEMSATCGKRRANADALLKAYQAARLLHLDSPEFGVKDGSTTQLVHTWETKYKKAAAEHEFYCSQSAKDLKEITDAVHKKEAAAIANAAQAGLLAAKASLKKKRDAAERASKLAKKRRNRERAQKIALEKLAKEKTAKLAKESIAKSMSSLKKLPQLSKHLYGQVLDATTGAQLSGSNVKTSCLFKTSRGMSGNGGRFTLEGGIQGPAGRECNLSVSKKGFVTTKFPVRVVKGETDSFYRTAVILPKVKNADKYRFVLQFGSSPPNLNAHLMVPNRKAAGGYVDLAGQADLAVPGHSVKFGHLGTKKKMPYATVDHTAERFGPETISMHKVVNGKYYFFVTNGAKSFTTPAQFRDSTARVFLYKGNTLVKTVGIESAVGKPTQIWNVFTLKCKKGKCSMSTTNKFVNKSPV